MSNATDHLSTLRGLVALLDDEAVDAVRTAEGHLRVCVAHLSALAREVTDHVDRETAPEHPVQPKPKPTPKKA